MKPDAKIQFWYQLARFAGAVRPRIRIAASWSAITTSPGISVVIPSRAGKELLAAQLPGIVRELDRFPSEIIVVDNGSNDGTADWLRSTWAQVRIVVSAPPLSFARAVNRGIAVARHSHVCLLNNDMIVEPNFFTALVRAFEQVPDLFSATAQIFFPAGVRREETGKAVYSQPGPADFPIRCIDPFPGEDLSYVLYGSGGCTLYDTAKLRALGAVDQAFEPAYVEDLDLGYRAWLRGWPSVYVDGARLEHRHRATSSRYFTEEQLEDILDLNYLKFLARAVVDRRVFRTLWQQALVRLRIRAGLGLTGAKALRRAAGIALAGGPIASAGFPEDLLLAASSGGIAVFPGRAALATPRTLIAGSTPQPGAILVSYTEKLDTPSPELLASCVEVVLVSRADGPQAFRAALRQTARKWRPEVAYLHGPEMVQFVPDCAPARAVLEAC
ncbi:MAG TPA: glycosyltransferase [Bryobacteraceae bacterium]|nr:glycosyltransferase [Bryobacteraceae bacterium]